MMTWTIARSTICTECTEKRAKDVVAEMQRMGIDVRYGPCTEIPLGDEAFTKAFVAALDYADFGIRRTACPA